MPDQRRASCGARALLWSGARGGQTCIGCCAPAETRRGLTITWHASVLQPGVAAMALPFCFRSGASSLATQALAWTHDSSRLAIRGCHDKVHNRMAERILHKVGVDNIPVPGDGQSSLGLDFSQPFAPSVPTPPKNPQVCCLKCWAALEIAGLPEHREHP